MSSLKLRIDRVSWIHDHLIVPRQIADDEFSSRIASHIKDFTLAYASTDLGLAIPLLTNLRFLPSRMLNLILSDDSFAAALSNKRDAVHLGGISFDEGTYYSAVQRAFASGTSHCHSLAGVEFNISLFTAMHTRIPGIVLSTSSNTVLAAEFNSLYTVFSGEISEEKISEILETCELTPSNRIEIQTKLLSADPLDNFLLLRRTCMNSATWFYSEIIAKLRASENVPYDELLPNVEKLLTFIGFQNTNISLDQAATQLVASTSVVVAIERWACVPTALPDVLLQNFFQLTKAQQRKGIKRLIRRIVSPIALLNLIPIILGVVLPQSREKILERLLRFASRQFSSGIYRLNINLALIFASALSRSPAVDAWSGQSYLAASWSNAGETLRIILALKLDIATLANIHNSPEVAFEEILSPHGPRIDAAHPSKTEPETLLLALLHDCNKRGIHILPSLYDEIISLLISKKGNRSAFQPSLFFNATTLPNALYSSLAILRHVQIDSIFGSEVALAFEKASNLDDLSQYLTEKVATSQASLLEAGLLGYLRTSFLDTVVEHPQLNKHLHEWSNTLDFTKIILSNNERWYKLYDFVVRHAIAARDHVAIEFLRDQYHNCLISIKERNKKSNGLDYENLLRIAVLLSPSGTRDERIAYIAQRLQQCLDTCNDSAAVVHRIAFLCVRRIAADKVHYFSNVLLRSRCM